MNKSQISPVIFSADTILKHGQQLSDMLLNLKQITSDEHLRGAWFVVTDDDMYPTLRANGIAHAALLDKADYQSAIGNAAILTTAKREFYYIGRVKHISDEFIDMTQDNNSGPGLTIKLDHWHQLFLVTYTMGGGVR